MFTATITNDQDFHVWGSVFSLASGLVGWLSDDGVGVDLLDIVQAFQGIQ